MLNSRRLNLALGCALLLGLVGAGQASAFIYTNGGDTILRGTLAGTPNLPLIAGLSGGKGLAMDGDHIYWVNSWTGTIGRANIDGSDVNQDFITGSHVEDGQSSVSSVAVDGAHIYWNDVVLTRYDDGQGGVEEYYRATIARANLDGTGVDRSFITALRSPTAVAVDAGHVYWADHPFIGRANLDGTGVEPAFIHYNAPFSSQGGLAVDGGHIYWSKSAGLFSSPPGAISRSNLDGSGVNESFIRPVDFPRGLALAVGHIYWTSSDTAIGRANLDGSGANTNFAREFGGNAIAVDELVSAPTSTSVSCSPASVIVGSPSTCTATVTDTGTAAVSSPSGTVNFATSRFDGVFAPRLSDDGSAGQCTLSPRPGGSASCSVTWTPADAQHAAPRTDTITGAYVQSVLHSTSSGSGTVSVTLPDTTPPETTITSGPSGPTNDNTPTFVFSSEAGATFQCRVDSAVFASCSSPLTTGVLADGSHTFQVRASDAAGNTDATPASATFVVDTVAPTVGCGASDGLWHANNVSIACTASDATSGLATAGDASFPLSTSVAAGSETANAATGTRLVCDKAGNCSTAGPVAGNKVDRKSPTITLTRPGANATYSFLGTLLAPVKVAYSCSDGGSGVAACNGTQPNGATLDTGLLAILGPHSFTVNSTDVAGNTATVTNNYTVGL